MLKRSFKSKLEIRSGGEPPILQGYGFTFDEVTQDGSYGREQFATDVKVDFPAKVFLLRDHDRSKVLARRGRNLSVQTDRKGLFFSVDKLPKTPLAEETRELIQKGILEDVSIGFMSIDSEVKNDIRIYKHIELHELSILPWGYFETSQVTARSNNKITYPPECLC